jgi:aminoglycoside 6'-N-acetyltransferase I
LNIRYGLELRAAAKVEAADLAELLGLAGQVISPGDLGSRLEDMGRGRGAALVALQWGPPCGLVVLHWYQTLAAAQPTAQITTLFVAPDERRKGIGRMLLKAASQAARVAGCGAIEVVAAECGSGLHEFCHSTGFTDTGTYFVRALRKQN